MSSPDVVVKETIWQSRATAGHRERFCFVLTTDDKLVLELRRQDTIPTFCEISEFPKSLAEAVQGIRVEYLKSFAFQIPDEDPILIGKLWGKAHEETERIHFGWEGGSGPLYVYPADLTQLLEEIRERFPEN